MKRFNPNFGTVCDGLQCNKKVVVHIRDVAVEKYDLLAAIFVCGSTQDCRFDHAQVFKLEAVLVHRFLDVVSSDPDYRRMGTESPSDIGRQLTDHLVPCRVDALAKLKPIISMGFL